MARKQSTPETPEAEQLAPPEAAMLQEDQSNPSGAASLAGESEPDWDAITDEVKVESGTGMNGGAAGAVPEMSRAEQEKLRKEIFYSAFGAALNAPNIVRAMRKQPGLKSLRLDQYGDLGREASDQLHDRMMEIPWFEKAFGPVNLFMARYGAIFALGLTISQSMRAEIAAMAEADAAGA